jgi:hypothetical protein
MPQLAYPDLIEASSGRAQSGPTYRLVIAPGQLLEGVAEDGEKRLH